MSQEFQVSDLVSGLGEIKAGNVSQAGNFHPHPSSLGKPGTVSHWIAINAGVFPFSRQDNMKLFSLSELGLPTENKAMQGILCPMAVELCHLLLTLERGDGICPAFPNLGEKAGKLAKAMEELAAVARR